MGLPRLTLRQLCYFGAVARLSHFGRAAEICAVSQPALSVQIQELERTLGVELVERGRGSIVLTPEGKEIARRARRILGEVEDLVAAVSSGAEGRALRLGVIPTIAPYLVPRLLNGFVALGRKIAIEVRESQTGRLVDELTQGQLDVALIALPAATSDLEVQPLFDDPFLLATPADLDLGDEVGVEVLGNHRLLLLEEGHCLREQALGVCRLASPEALTSLGATSLTTLIELVAAGQGVTLLPALAEPAFCNHPRLRLVRLRAPAPHRTIALAWRSSSPRKTLLRRLGTYITSRRAA